MSSALRGGCWNHLRGISSKILLAKGLNQIIDWWLRVSLNMSNFEGVCGLSPINEDSGLGMSGDKARKSTKPTTKLKEE